MAKRRGRRVQTVPWSARIAKTLTATRLVSALSVVLLVVGALTLATNNDAERAAAPTNSDIAEMLRGGTSAVSLGGPEARGPAVQVAQMQQLATDRARSIEDLRVKAMDVAAALATPTKFRIQAFNVLGSSHTKPGADAAHFASGRQRAAWIRDIVARLGSDVIGFQEMFPDQLAVLRGGLPHFAWYPGTALGNEGIKSNIGWDNKKFRLVEARHIRIPFIRQHRKVSYIKLEDRGNKKQFWFFNVHNAPRNQQAQRNQNLSAEVAAIRQMEKDRIPIFMVGDFNENRDGISGRTSLDRAPGRLHIEQIYGSPGTLKNFIVHRDAQTRRATDHRVPYSDVVID